MNIWKRMNYLNQVSSCQYLRTSLSSRCTGIYVLLSCMLRCWSSSGTTMGQ